MSLPSRDRHYLWQIFVLSARPIHLFLFCHKIRPLLLQDYFGTISGTISSTTNSTKVVPETCEKNGLFGGGFRYYSWYYYLWYYFFDVIMSCDQDKTGTD
jgi:hypothetical protein